MTAFVISSLIIGFIVINLHRLEDFQPFNSWLMLFFCSLLLFPILSAVVLIEGFVGIVDELPMRTIKAITIPSLFGGVSLFLLFNAIRKLPGIAALLLFAISSLLIYGILSSVGVFYWVLPVLLLLGVIFLLKSSILNRNVSLKGALLPILGGLASFGFVKALQVEPITISELLQSFGNKPWQVVLFQIDLMSIASGIFVFPIFLAQMGQKNAWMYFDTPHLVKNILILFGLSLLVFVSAFLSLYFLNQF